MFIGPYRLSVLCLTAALLLAVLPAQASSISYTDPNAWASATTGTSEITFAGIAPAGGVKDESTPTGLTLDGVDFIGQWTASTNQLHVLDKNNASPWFNWNEPALLESPDYNLSENQAFIPFIHVVLPANTTAFAALLGTANPHGWPYQVTLSDGEVFTAPTKEYPNLAFFGITADDPITYADFTLLSLEPHTGSNGLMTDFQIGTSSTVRTGGSGDDPADTPEACTSLLIGSGLIALRIFREHLPMLG